jgi:hypothetical protein
MISRLGGNMVDVNDDIRIEKELKRSKGEWKWKVYQLINEETIPPGYLINYGRLEELTNEKYRTIINARNVANLRRKLYGYKRGGEYVFPKNLPLHRIAKKGDVKSEYDSDQTRQENNLLRGKEGSLMNPIWI